MGVMKCNIENKIKILDELKQQLFLKLNVPFQGALFGVIYDKYNDCYFYKNFVIWNEKDAILAEVPEFIVLSIDSQIKLYNEIVKDFKC